MKSTRSKDVLGGLMIGIIACLILMACGSDNSQAGVGTAQNPATSSASNSFATTGTGAGAGATVVSQIPAGPTVASVNQAVQSGPVNPTGNLNQDVRAVIKAVRPAIVEIVAETVNSNDFGSIFGRQQPTERGIGTGSIISQDGYIMTNNHVVEGANKFTVVLPDNRTYAGRLIGREGQQSDVAVIKIDPKSGETLPTVTLGDSSKLEIGEAVVAIGNALGLPGGPTVTAGIISAIGRSIQEPNGAQLTDLLQTDAAINPGNSGGPLLNLRGELIGINTAAPVDQSQGTVAQGIGFALNINQTRPLVDAFIKGGGGTNGAPPAQTAARPFIGVLPQAMTAGLQARYQLPINYGILVSRVDPNTPAAQAGLQAGDIIVKMDNTDLKSLDDLAGVLSRHKAGDQVSVNVVARNGQQRQVSLTFGRAPQQN